MAVGVSGSLRLPVRGSWLESASSVMSRVAVWAASAVSRVVPSWMLSMCR